LKPFEFFKPLKLFFMQELLEKLKAEAGLTEEQAKKAIETIKNYVVEKFPMLEGAVGNLFGNS
jgi:sRNA-binding protein